ncbi:putative RNA-directed DNA polymerase, eukaryota, reverse transcriptase zinc-binding domain protein [Tanacetum coccineum]
MAHFKFDDLPNGCNASFVVLIPKKNDPLSFSDYRPISLIGCVYKVISKLLSSRLARVIDSVVGPNQSAFIEGRQILDGCLIANEIIRMASLENQKLLLFKVDFEKTFDSVNWKFLLSVMRQMGFGLKWRKWIYSCLSSASISVMINGSPSKEFKMERGLRQGDPLSPFLFLLVAEALQVTILETCSVGLYNGISLASNGANISLLKYADDALFFGEWSRWNANNLIHILKCFELGSGLKVNLAKSRIIGVGVPIEVVEEVVVSLGCVHDSLPFIYLGLPVGRKMRLCEGGRLTLIKSVLGSIPIFYLSLFKSPVKIIDALESLRCRFFWGFKEGKSGMYWVKWNSILLDPKFGGLGVGSLHAKNLSLLGKWKWRFLSDDKGLWRVVINEFYGSEGGFNSPLNNFKSGGIWVVDIIKAVKKIEAIDDSFRLSFMRKVVDGGSTLFWKDPWCGDGYRLMDIFPRLYALDSCKDCLVKDRWKFDNGAWCGNWNWRFPLGVELSMMSLISSL